MSEDDLKKPFSRLDGPSSDTGPGSRGRRWPMALRDLDPTSSARRRVLDRLSDDDDSVRVISAGGPAILPNPLGPSTPRPSFARGQLSAERAERTPSARERTPSPRAPVSSRPPSVRVPPRTPTPPPTDAITSLPISSRRRSLPPIEAPPVDDGFARVVPRQRRGVATPPPVDRALPALSLSPRMTAIFGALFGLATMTTIIALLIQAAPPRDDRAAAASASAASLASAAGAPGAPGAPASKKRVRTKLPGPWRLSALEKDPSVRIVSATMDQRSFVTALDEKGVPKDQVYRLIKAFDGVHSFDKTNKKDKFIVAIDRQSKQVKAFEYVVSGEEIYQAKEGDGGALVATQLDLKIANEEVSGSIYIGKNLGRSIEAGGFENGLAKAIDEAFLGRISSEGFEEGGTLRVVAIETTALGEFVRYKQIVAVEYHPPDPSAPGIRAYNYDGVRFHGYVDEQGRAPDGSGWTKPVPTAPITSHYNPKRLHPILKKIVPHTGTDFGAPTGTPIYAAFKGKVTLAGNAGPCGQMVQIDHPGGIQSGYCHMSKFAPGIKEGMVVGTKQLIGYVGTTGRSTGPHLHFWVKKDGVFFDAETLKLNGLKPLAPEERDGFAARKAELDARLDGIALPEPPPPDPTPSKPSPSDTPDIGSNSKVDDPSDVEASGDVSGDSKPPKKSDKPDKKPDKKPPPEDPGDDGEDLVGADLGGGK
ncbi:MAG: peptidoglycan DD-metalloendopeptidase family protein [Polyangiaceae bacterium]